MPDREYESSTVRVRSTKNIIARLNVVPAPRTKILAVSTIMEIISVNSIPYFLEIFGMNGENKPKMTSGRIFIKPTIVLLIFSSSVKMAQEARQKRLAILRSHQSVQLQ